LKMPKSQTLLIATQLKHSKHKIATAIAEGPAPEWDEVLTLPVENRSQSVVRFTLVNAPRKGEREEIAEVELNLAEIVHSDDYLGKKPFTVSFPNDSELSISVELLNAVFAGGLPPPEMGPSSNGGAICVKTKYAASTQTLKIVVDGARGLPAADTNGLSDPFAQVSFGEKRKKSEVVKKTLNPDWCAVIEFSGVTPSQVSTVPIDVE
jgi:Ca2+-dependent lipid-binding protein